MVNLTRICTKTGDSGTTALGDMSQVGKTDSRLIAYVGVRTEYVRKGPSG